MHKYSLFRYLRKYFRETLLATCLWLIYELFDHLGFEQAWSILWPALVFGTIFGLTSVVEAIYKDKHKKSN